MPEERLEELRTMESGPAARQKRDHTKSPPALSLTEVLDAADRGAIIGGLAGVFCDDAGVCSRPRSY